MTHYKTNIYLRLKLLFHITRSSPSVATSCQRRRKSRGHIVPRCDFLLADILLPPVLHLEPGSDWSFCGRVCAHSHVLLFEPLSCRSLPFGDEPFTHDVTIHSQASLERLPDLVDRDWLSHWSSLVNAEVVGSTESPLCQLIISQ